MKPLIYLIIALFLSSCCKSKLIDTIRFTAPELSINPYSGAEELRFVDNNGFVVIYTNGSRTINQIKVNECDGGCCDYYNVEMSDNTYYESDYKKSNIQVIILNDFDKYSGTKGTPIIHFAWDYYDIEPYVTGTSFGGIPVDSMPEKGIEYGLLFDSITLRGTTYYNIYTFSGSCSYPDRLHGDTLYYSITEGIVGLKFSDENLWVKQ